MMYNVVGVRYACGCKVYNFDAGDQDLRNGDTVLVDSEQGVGVATVVLPVRQEERGENDKPLKKVIRKATADDHARIEMSKSKEAEAFSICQKKILEREMVMKLVRVEWAFDNSKATFYFTADGRVDFRDLVRDLAHRLKIRIEMRQIGVRDEAKMLGGFGPCGRELCCATFLQEFEPVSIKMAKKQDLVLNPAKISGTCGRLMCCLGYEYSFYDEIRKAERRKPLPQQEEYVPHAEPEHEAAASGEQKQQPGDEQSKNKRRRSAWRKKQGKGKPREEGQQGQPAPEKKQEAQAGAKQEQKPGGPDRPRRRRRRSGRGGPKGPDKGKGGDSGGGPKGEGA